MPAPRVKHFFFNKATSPNSVTFYCAHFLSNHKIHCVQNVLVIYLWACGYPLDSGWPNMGNTLTKVGSVSPCRYQLSISSMLRVGLWGPFHVGIFFYFILYRSQQLWVYKGHGSAAFRKHWFFVLIWIFLSHLSQWSLNHGRHGYDIDVPFGAQRSTVSDYLQLDEVWISLWIDIYWEKKAFLFLLSVE